MNSNKPHHILDFVKNELTSKGIIKLKAGSLVKSMGKLIAQNDTLTFTRIDPDSLCYWDVVLFYNGEQLVAHRVIAISQELIITRGDQNLHNDEPKQKKDYLAKLIKIERSGKEIDLSSIKPEEPPIDFLLLNASLPKQFRREDYVVILMEKLSGNKEIALSLYAEGLAPLFFFYNQELLTNYNLPDEIVQKLRASYYDTLARNMVVLQKLKESLANLIPTKYILLRGAFLAESIYETPGLRPFSDIDILVAPEDFEAVALNFKKAGFIAESDDICPKKNLEDVWLNSVCFSNHQEIMMNLHLHWHWCNSNRPIYLSKSKNMSKVWAETTSPTLCETSKEVSLSSENLLIHLSEHAIKHSFDRLILLRDIMELLIKKNKEIDWQLLEENAFRFGMERHLYYTLLYVSRILPFFVPAAVLAKLQPINNSFLSKKFFHLAEKGIRDPEIVNLFYFEMMPGLKDKFLFIKRTLFPLSYNGSNISNKFFEKASRILKIFTRFYLLIHKVCSKKIYLFTLLLLAFSTHLHAEEDEWIGEDKELHFIASFAINSCGYWFGREAISLSKKEAISMSALGTFGVGVAKELSDEEFSYKDLTWNCFGIATSSFLWWILDRRHEEKDGIKASFVFLADCGFVVISGYF